MSWGTDSGALQPLLDYVTDVRWTSDARMALSGNGPPSVRSRRRPTPMGHHDIEVGGVRRAMPRSLRLTFDGVPNRLALKVEEFYRAHRSRAFSMRLDDGRLIQVVAERPPQVALGIKRGRAVLELRESLTTRQDDS